MSLTDQDLEKIKAVIDSRANLQNEKCDRRIAEIESSMAAKQDLNDLEERMATKEQLEVMKKMFEGNNKGIVKDVAGLKVWCTKLGSHHV